MNKNEVYLVINRGDVSMDWSINIDVLEAGEIPIGEVLGEAYFAMRRKIDEELGGK